MTEHDSLEALGAGPMPAQRKLETFACPDNVHEVEFVTDELLCSCPVTGQPDMYRARIRYRPDARAIESKSLKLFLWSWRDESLFAEDLASRIATHVMTCDPISVDVELMQNIRGGIVTVVRATEAK